MTATVADGAPARMTSPGGDRTWQRRERELPVRVSSLHAQVRDAVDAGPTAWFPVLGDPRPRAETIASLTLYCIDRMRLSAGTDSETTERLCRLVMDLQELAFDLYFRDLGERDRRLTGCSTGLLRLRALPGSAGLLDRTCEEIVRSCGFGRAVLSRVEDGMWLPWMAYFREDDEFESWFVRWVDRAIPLEGRTPETRLLADRRPKVVYDTESTTVHRPIIVESGHSTSYVAVPMLRGADVVGFLHADHHPSSRRVDEFDRNLLLAFAYGLGQISERTALAERLRTQRDHVREIMTSAVQTINDLCDAGIDLGRYAEAGALSAPGGLSPPATVVDLLASATTV